MIHIVFNEIETELMQKVIDLDATLSGDILIKNVDLRRTIPAWHFRRA